ncbi:MAG: hypothetical protein IJM97_04430 [Clostridia bacterium]|nr:hypothetical protein [Clostridia bacterium]
MKTKLKTALIIIVIAAIFGGVTYFKLMPESEYKDVDWQSYEHSDIYDSHYYLNLSTKEKVAYENILKEYRTFPDKIEIPPLSDDELTRVYTAVLYDNPLIFCMSNSCKIVTDGRAQYFAPDYIMTSEEYENKLTEITNLTPDLLASLPAGDYNVELYLHDYIIGRCSYTEKKPGDERNVYGALINGVASCEGYSYAMKYLCDLFELDCYVIFGRAENKNGDIGNHLWNIINIDGDKYHLDVTWNDTIAKDDPSGDYRYMYFNVTDDEISQTHSNFKTDDKCTETKANYYVKNNLNFTQFGEAQKQQLAKLIAAAADEGRSSFSIRFDTTDLFSVAEKSLIKKQQIYPIIIKASKLTDKKIDTKIVHYRSVEDVNVLEFMFSVV